ncbi:MAG: hypothetical protein U0903_01230 [Planctomycetales bacterium]
MAELNDPGMNQKEFLALLPLTLSLAGLPPSEPGKYYNEDQIEARAFTIRHAYKAARVLFRDLSLQPPR